MRESAARASSKPIVSADIDADGLIAKVYGAFKQARTNECPCGLETQIDARAISELKDSERFQKSQLFYKHNALHIAQRQQKTFPNPLAGVLLVSTRIHDI